MKPRAPRFQWPPPGDEDKQFHNEVAAPAVILRELGADIAIGPPAARGKGGKPQWSSLDDWLKSTDSGMSGLTLGGGRSWNHPQLLMAARGLALGDWGDAGKLMAMQAGRIPGEGMAAFLDGEEPRSTDYDPYRWAAELVFASRGPIDIRVASRITLSRQIALAALGAVPWTDTSGDFSGAKGQLWHRGPTLSPVGERSPKTSNADQLGIFQRLARGAGGTGREGFAGSVADICRVGSGGIVGDRLSLESGPDHPRRALALLGDAKVYGSFLFRMYPEGLLVMRPEQLNSNTPSALWSFADHATKRQTRGWPFPEGKQRGKGAAKPLGCAIEGGDVVARCRTIEGEVLEARFTLPKSTPIWSVVVDETGARFE